MSHDLRYAVRALWKNPGFTAAAVVSLALGIGANTTIFTWMSAVLLNPLPGVKDGHQLAVVTATAGRESGRSLSYLDYVDYAATPGLAGLVAQDEVSVSLSADGRAERTWALIVSENYFDVLGVKPALGRGFSAEDAHTRAPVLVISHGLWARRFAGDPGIVGRTVLVNKQPFTVIGVAPLEFRGSVVGLSLDAWVPLSAQSLVLPGDRLRRRGNRWLQAVARLAPATTRAQAQAALDATALRLAQTHPEDHGLGVKLDTFWAAPVGGGAALGPVLKVLAAVVAVVLLIACANVANLLIARATGRRREIAVRLALGASRFRLVRQLLTESALLAFLGGAAGMVLALWGSGLLLLFAPSSDLPIGLSPRLDARALLFTAALSVLTALLFGLVPALQATRPRVAPTLREEQSSVIGGARARLRAGLVVAQVALSLLLLVSAGLLVRSLQAATRMDPGFNPRGLLIASVDLFAGGYTPETGKRFFGEAVERLRGLPAVTNVTLTRRAPLGFGGSSSSTMEVEGYAPPPHQPAWAFTHVVAADFFRTLQAPLARGRDFTDADGPDAPKVAIVDETMARLYWGDKDPVGGRVRWQDDWMTVVGVARTMKHRQLTERPGPHLFAPVQQVYAPQMTFVLRTAGDPVAVAPAVLTQLRGLDAQLPVFAVFPLEEHAKAATFQQRMGGTFLAAFGALALVLAAIGLYGLLTFTVGQRTREIGIRMALGSSRRDVVALVLRNGLVLTAAGIVLGLAGALGATRLMGRLLVGVSPTDPLTFALVATGLVAMGALACAVPARRATRIDPVVALRYE